MELIQILLEKVGAQPIDGYVDQDFYLPYETTATLIEKGLIKELIKGLPVEETPVETVEETPVEEIEAPTEEVDENDEEDVIKLDVNSGVKYRYSRTYLARLIQSDDQIKGYYGAIKNKFLSYKKVKARISKRCETVYLGRKKLAKLNVIGKKIDLYLALDPNEFTDQAKFYNFKDVSDKKKDFPMLMRISGPIKLKRALELIQILLEKVGAQPINGYVDQDFYLPYETTAALIEKGLIKELIKGLPVEETPIETVEETPVKAIEAPTEEVEEVAVSIAPTAVENTDELEDTNDLEEGGYEEENDELPTRGRENVGVVFGVTCVFKPYYDGYKLDDVLAIPVSKQRFETFKEKKQIKIFKRAEKKRMKKLKKK